jgi:hypothetical protein
MTDRTDDTEDFCYAEACFCRMTHRLWPFGISGDSNLFQEQAPRVGRMIGGKFYLRIDDPVALTKVTVGHLEKVIGNIS